MQLARLSAWLRTARDVIVGRKAAESDSPQKPWIGTLHQVIADLELLNHNTEQDFLRIGGKLAEFIAAVNLVSSELTDLASLTSGEHGQRASQALNSALDHSMIMGARHANHDGGLSGMRQNAGRLEHTLSGYHGTVVAFHTLGMLTRIETARLGSADSDFGNLADDLNLLVGNVQAKVESALENAALLVPPIESALQDIAAFEEGQAKSLPPVISEVLASLSSFRDMQTRAHQASIQLGGDYGAISCAFKKLIVSLQFHDITRQQVEHVIEVLRRLCSESAGTSGSGSRDPRAIAAVVTLQSSQLADAGEKFAASVGSVTLNLEDIATHVLEMTGESRTASGLSDDEHNSFFLQMERGCTAILTSLTHCASAEAATRITSDGLGATIGRMRGSVEEIRGIEIQMQRMALNASIRSAHIGVSGNALSVLAASMQQRALESSERSDALAEVLDSMSQAATRVSGQGEPALTAEGGNRDGYLEAMRLAVADLHSSTERSFSQTAQIGARGARLREDLAVTRQSFSAGALFAETVSRARGMLKEIVENNQSGLPIAGTEALEPGLAGFATHYTMQSERDVHEGVTRSVVEAAPIAVTVEHSESAPKEAEELGDNVEFF